MSSSPGAQCSESGSDHRTDPSRIGKQTEGRTGVSATTSGDNSAFEGTGVSEFRSSHGNDLNHIDEIFSDNESLPCENKSCSLHGICVESNRSQAGSAHDDSISYSSPDDAVVLINVASSRSGSVEEEGRLLDLSNGNNPCTSRSPPRSTVVTSSPDITLVTRALGPPSPLPTVSVTPPVAPNNEPESSGGHVINVKLDFGPRVQFNHNYNSCSQDGAASKTNIIDNITVGEAEDPPEENTEDTSIADVCEPDLLNLDNSPPPNPIGLDTTENIDLDNIANNNNATTTSTSTSSNVDNGQMDKVQGDVGFRQSDEEALQKKKFFDGKHSTGNTKKKSTTGGSRAPVTATPNGNAANYAQQLDLGLPFAMEDFAPAVDYAARHSSSFGSDAPDPANFEDTPDPASANFFEDADTSTY